MPFKQPRSVQVVLFARGEDKGREYLLLKRVNQHGGFWQSVTGSLEQDETHRQAAVREVREETGISCREEELLDLHLTNKFPIAARWLPKYGPGVTHNEEVCFALQVEKGPVTLDTLEHEGYVWLAYETALAMVFWQSNKEALRMTEQLLRRSVA